MGNMPGSQKPVEVNDEFDILKEVGIPDSEIPKKGVLVPPAERENLAATGPETEDFEAPEPSPELDAGEVPDGADDGEDGEEGEAQDSEGLSEAEAETSEERAEEAAPEPEPETPPLPDKPEAPAIQHPDPFEAALRKEHGEWIAAYNKAKVLEQEAIAAEKEYLEKQESGEPSHHEYRRWQRLADQVEDVAKETVRHKDRFEQINRGYQNYLKVSTEKQLKPDMAMAYQVAAARGILDATADNQKLQDALIAAIYREIHGVGPEPKTPANHKVQPPAKKKFAGTVIPAGGSNKRHGGTKSEKVTYTESDLETLNALPALREILLPAGK